MSITISDLMIRTYAPEILTGYGNQDYAARKILPPITVKSKDTKLAAFTADGLRVVESLNSGTDKAAEVNDGMAYVDLDTKFRALGKKFNQDTMDEFPNGVAVTKYAYGLITEAFQIEEEKNLAAAMVTSGNYTLSNYDTPSTKFNTSGGDPVAFFNAARVIVKGNCTKDPNCIAVSWKLHLTLADIARDSLGGNSSYRMPTNNELAAYYGFQEYHVLGADYNSSVEGQATSLAAIWGDDNFFMYYKPRSPKAMEPAFGYTVFVGPSMRQAKETGVDPQPWTRFIASMDYQSKVLSYAAAYWGYTCLS
jgi:hypothetical protein